MTDTSRYRELTRSDGWFLGAFSLFVLALHLIYNRWYGYHHDEFYFLDCGRHFAFGYVDHPPLVPWIAAFSDWLFGKSLPGLRFFPALASAAAVFLTGLLARRMGGGRFAQAVACIAMIIAPVYLRAGNMLAIPSFEPFYWVLCSYLVVRVTQEDNPKLWLWVGLAAGVGLMNKHTMALFGLGLTVGLLFTPQRKQFKSPWLYAGGLVALLVFLPNLVWQIANGWPTLYFIAGLNARVMQGISLPQFVLGQFLYLHPINAPIWIAGLVFLLFRREGRPYRVLGWVFVTVFVLLVVIKSKIYYLAPAYPALLAAGAMAVERYGARPGRAWVRPASLAALGAGGLVFMPVALPVFNIDRTDRYINGLTFGAFSNIWEVTGDLHAQFGWKERLEALSRVYHGLSPEERERTAIYSDGYDMAGAIDYLGGAYGLPHAISGAVTYYLWGPGERPIETVIAVGVKRSMLDTLFDSVEAERPVILEHVIPDEREFRIYVCRKPRRPLREVWPELRWW